MAFITPQPGTAGQVYTAAAHNVIVDDLNYLHTPPTALVTRTTSQTTTNLTGALLAYTAGASYDTDTMFDSGSNTILTIKTAGIYLIYAGALWASNATGARYLTVQKGSSNTFIDLGVPAVNGFDQGMSVSGTLKLAVNDTIRVSAFQNSGGNLNINSAEFSATWIGSG